MSESIFRRLAIRSLLATSLMMVSLIAQTHAADSAANAQAKKYFAPRTEYGDPDLRGVWNFSSVTPLERPKSDGDKAFKTTEEAAAKK